jgi:hypothetical protein
MRKFFLMLIACFFFCFADAQLKKIFGYVQEVDGGARQDDNLSANKANTGNNRYFLFTEAKKRNAIFFEQVWIKGRLYNFKIDTIKAFPFIWKTSNGGELIFSDTLVRSSKEIILRLKDLAGSDRVIAKANRNLIAKNDVVIFYRYKNGLQSITLQKLKKMRPLFTQ